MKDPFLIKNKKLTDMYKKESKLLCEYDNIKVTPSHSVQTDYLNKTNYF